MSNAMFVWRHVLMAAIVANVCFLAGLFALGLHMSIDLYSTYGMVVAAIIAAWLSSTAIYRWWSGAGKDWSVTGFVLRVVGIALLLYIPLSFICIALLHSVLSLLFGGQIDMVGSMRYAMAMAVYASILGVIVAAVPVFMFEYLVCRSAIRQRFVGVMN